MSIDFTNRYLVEVYEYNKHWLRRMKPKRVIINVHTVFICTDLG
jgi:hypothetical protein